VSEEIDEYAGGNIWIADIVEARKVALAALRLWGEDKQMIALAGEAGELVGSVARVQTRHPGERRDHEAAALEEVADVLIVALSLWSPEAIMDALERKTAKLETKIVECGGSLE